MSVDFLQMFVTNPQLMLDEQDAWQVVDGEVFSITNMTDDELSEAIIDDVLCVTMFEMQTGQKLHFDCSTLQRFLKTDELRQRVNSVLMNNPQMMYFIDGHTFRIRNSVHVLQEAMDFCGTFYTGYEMPEGVISVNRQELDSMMSLFDQLENIATSLSMELVSPHRPGHA